MKAVVILCLLAAVLADKDAKIRNYQYGIEEDGSYNAEYETTNGISAQEEGISYPGAVPEAGNYVRKGSYSYTGDDGVTYTVEWVADENGFQPTGEHLPDFSHTQEHIGKVEEE